MFEKYFWYVITTVVVSKTKKKKQKQKQKQKQRLKKRQKIEYQRSEDDKNLSSTAKKKEIAFISKNNVKKKKTEE